MVGIILLLRTVISVIRVKFKNVVCLRFEKRLRNIGSISREINFKTKLKL